MKHHLAWTSIFGLDEHSSKCPAFFGVHHPQGGLDISTSTQVPTTKGDAKRSSHSLSQFEVDRSLAELTIRMRREWRLYLGKYIIIVIIMMMIMIIVIVMMIMIMIIMMIYIYICYIILYIYTYICVYVNDGTLILCNQLCPMWVCCNTGIYRDIIWFHCIGIQSDILAYQTSTMMFGFVWKYSIRAIMAI